MTTASRIAQIIQQRTEFDKFTLDHRSKTLLKKDDQALKRRLKYERAMHARLKPPIMAEPKQSISLYNTRGCKHVKELENSMKELKIKV